MARELNIHNLFEDILKARLFVTHSDQTALSRYLFVVWTLQYMIMILSSCLIHAHA